MLWWLGHKERMEEDWLVKRIIGFDVRAVQLRERPRMGWHGWAGCSSLLWRGLGGFVVQCLAHDLKVASLILAHGSFLVRVVVLSC